MTTKNDNTTESTSKDDDKDLSIKEILDAVDDTDPVNEDAVEQSEPSTLSDAGKAQLMAANVIPIHAATAKPVDKRPGANLPGAKKRGRGRPKKIEKQPTPEDLAYHQAMQAAQVAFVEQDIIHRTTCAKTDSAELLQASKERIARLIAVLEWQRIEEAKYGKLDGALISRQVAAIKELGLIELKIRELGVQMFDLRNDNFQKVFAYLIETFRDVAHQSLPDAQFDLLFNKLETEMQGWEDRAENLFVEK